MTGMPIPKALLSDSVTLLVPDGDGFSSADISAVRVQYSSAVREYSAVVMRDESEITVYYDLVNSRPVGVSFAAGMLLLHEGRRYEILSAERFDAFSPHHIRIKARLV